MRNLIEALRTEITRLARKEARGQMQGLKSASSRYRSDIADLKRVTNDLDKRLSFLEEQEKKRAQEPPSPELAEGARFSPAGLKSHREKLDMSAEDYGLLVGLSAPTIYNYESGKTKPRKAQLAKLVAVRDLGKREARRRLALLKD